MVVNNASAIQCDHLLLNEICYNQSPKISCWIEIYNPTLNDINSSNINLTLQFTCYWGPSHIDDFIIKSHGYAILCDNVSFFKSEYSLPPDVPCGRVYGYGDPNNAVFLCKESYVNYGTIDSISLDIHGYDPLPVSIQGSWSRYYNDYDSNIFENDFYDSVPTPGLPNLISKPYASIFIEPKTKGITDTSDESIYNITRDDFFYYNVSTNESMNIDSFNISNIPNDIMILQVNLYISYLMFSYNSTTPVGIRIENGTLINTTVIPDGFDNHYITRTYNLSKDGVDTISKIAYLKIEFINNSTLYYDNTIPFNFIWLEIVYENIATETSVQLLIIILPILTIVNITLKLKKI